MKHNKTTDLIEALKEYNKTLADQIKRMKSFIEEIDKQLIYHKKPEQNMPTKKVNSSFSRQYLINKVDKNKN